MPCRTLVTFSQHSPQQHSPPVLCPLVEWGDSPVVGGSLRLARGSWNGQDTVPLFCPYRMLTHAGMVPMMLGALFW